MASILKVDDLRGNTAAGDITITSEGGSATQSLQQGLAKAWALDETLSTSSAGFTEDSLNVSSTSDEGTGNMHINLTNAFLALNYASTGTNAGHSADDLVVTHYGDSTTSKDDLRVFDTAVKDAALSYIAIGDLA